MQRRWTVATAIGTAGAVVLAGSALAYAADNLYVDGDSLIVGTPNINAGSYQSPMDLGLVCPGDEKTASATIWIYHNNGGAEWANDATLAFTVGTPSNPQVTAASVGPVKLPANWATNATDFDAANPAAGTYVTTPAPITLTVSSSAAYGSAGSATVNYSASGGRAGGGSNTKAKDLTIAWTVGSAGACAVNTPPTAPGAPVPTPASPMKALTSLAWTPSTDAEGDAFTYRLEGKRTGESYGLIAAGLSAASYSFASSPAEGTWTFRVRAEESASVFGGWAASAAVVVDMSAPNAPTAATTAAAPDFSAGDGKAWWKGSVQVSFTGNGDAALADGSPGSGVASVTAPETFTTTGKHEKSGTATDNVGWDSTAAAFVGYVDATPPVVSATCPTTPILGSAASATWGASDVGSGLATPASGTVTGVDTSAVGPHTVTIPAGTAKDNVGNESAAATCSYSVVYDWAGFFRPVDNPVVLNKVRAGSAVPVKFRLSADPAYANQGLDIFMAGSPASSAIECDLTDPSDVVEETVTAGSSSLTYDAAANQYVYVWKTDRLWAGKCRVLKVRLDDGSTHVANFQFTK